MRKSKEMPVGVNLAPDTRGDATLAGREAPLRRLGAEAGGTPGKPPLRVPDVPKAPVWSPADAGAS